MVALQGWNADFAYAGGNARGGVSFQTHGARTTIRFANIPVRSALQLIAEEGGFNLVVSDSVQGTVSLRLVDVTWEQALYIVLRLKGLRMHVEGSTRTIATASEAQGIGDPGGS